MNRIWYYEENGEAKGPLSREEMRDLVQAGSVTPQTRVWTRSLNRWAPAAETTLEGLFKLNSVKAQMPSPPPPPPAPNPLAPPPLPAATTAALNASTSSNEALSSPPAGFRSPRLLGNSATILILILTLLSVVKIWSQCQEIDLLDRIQHHAPNLNDEVLASDVRQRALAIGWMVAYGITVTCFCCWIYRLAHNVRALGARRLEFTPGWAVGFYFIPFVGLWKPYQAMKEIWKASDDPKHWRSTRANSIVGWWWTIWIITGLLNYIITRFTILLDSQAYTFRDQLGIIAEVSHFPLNVVAILLVQQLSTLQLKTATERS